MTGMEDRRAGSGGVGFGGWGGRAGGRWEEERMRASWRVVGVPVDDPGSYGVAAYGEWGGEWSAARRAEETERVCAHAAMWVGALRLQVEWLQERGGGWLGQVDVRQMVHVWARDGSWSYWLLGGRRPRGREVGGEEEEADAEGGGWSEGEAEEEVWVERGGEAARVLHPPPWPVEGRWWVRTVPEFRVGARWSPVGGVCWLVAELLEAHPGFAWLATRGPPRFRRCLARARDPDPARRMCVF